MQKKESPNIPDVNRDEWNVEELHEQGLYDMSDETLRRTLRGNEEVGNPDDRDIVGNVDPNETPQGRREAKNDVKGKANKNG
jgi:hypothetical protein